MKELKIKHNQILTKKNTTLFYNNCQCRQRFKSKIIKSKSYMAGITQNKQMPYFHCGP